MTPKTKRRCDSFDISKGRNTPSVKENLFFLDAKRLGVPALEFFFKNQFARRRRAIRTRFWPASKVLRVLSGNSKALTFKVGQKLRQMLLSLTHSAPGDSWFYGKVSWRSQNHYRQKNGYTQSGTRR